MNAVASPTNYGEYSKSTLVSSRAVQLLVSLLQGKLPFSEDILVILASSLSAALRLQSETKILSETQLLLLDQKLFNITYGRPSPRWPILCQKSAALLQAIDTRDTKLAERLINTGADVNFRSSDGQTPLKLAARTYQIKIFRLLLVHGARVYPEDARNLSAIEQHMYGKSLPSVEHSLTKAKSDGLRPSDAKISRRLGSRLHLNVDCGDHEIFSTRLLDIILQTISDPTDTAEWGEIDGWELYALDMQLCKSDDLKIIVDAVNRDKMMTANQAEVYCMQICHRSKIPDSISCPCRQNSIAVLSITDRPTDGSFRKSLKACQRGKLITVSDDSGRNGIATVGESKNSGLRFITIYVSSANGNILELKNLVAFPLPRYNCELERMENSSYCVLVSYILNYFPSYATVLLENVASTHWMDHLVSGYIDEAYHPQLAAVSVAAFCDAGFNIHSLTEDGCSFFEKILALCESPEHYDLMTSTIDSLIKDIHVDINIRNIRGKTVIQEAFRNGLSNVAQCILKQLSKEQFRSLQPFSLEDFNDCVECMYKSVSRIGLPLDEECKSLVSILHAQDNKDEILIHEDVPFIKLTPTMFCQILNDHSDILLRSRSFRSKPCGHENFLVTYLAQVIVNCKIPQIKLKKHFSRQILFKLRDNRRRTLLHLVAFHNDEGSITLISKFLELCSSAEVNKCLRIRDHYRRTALHYASKRNCVSYIRCLAKYASRSTLNRTDAFHRTALHYAAMQKWSSVAAFDKDSEQCYDILRSHGATIDVLDLYNGQPTDYLNAYTDWHLNPLQNDQLLFLEYINSLIKKELKVSELLEFRNTSLVSFSLTSFTGHSSEEFRLICRRLKEQSSDVLSDMDLLKSKINEFMLRLTEYIPYNDKRFKCHPILVGSAAEGTKTWLADEFDYNLNLVCFSNQTTLSTSPNCPPGFVTLTLKRQIQDTSLDIDEYRDVETNLLRVEKVKLKFRKLLKHALSNPQFWKSETFFELSCESEINLCKYNDKKCCITISLNAIDPGIPNISIDIVPTIHVEDFFPSQCLNLNKELLSQGCHLVLDSPRKFYPWLPESADRSYARISFARAESLLIRECPASLRAAFMLMKCFKDVVEGSLDFNLFHKSTHVIKTAVLFCLSAEASNKRTKIKLQSSSLGNTEGDEMMAMSLSRPTVLEASDDEKGKKNNNNADLLMPEDNVIVSGVSLKKVLSVDSLRDINMDEVLSLDKEVSNAYLEEAISDDTISEINRPMEEEMYDHTNSGVNFEKVCDTKADVNLELVQSENEKVKVNKDDVLADDKEPEVNLKEKLIEDDNADDETEEELSEDEIHFSLEQVTPEEVEYWLIKIINCLIRFHQLGYYPSYFSNEICRPVQKNEQYLGDILVNRSVRCPMVCMELDKVIQRYLQESLTTPDRGVNIVVFLQREQSGQYMRQPLASQQTFQLVGEISPDSTKQYSLVATENPLLERFDERAFSELLNSVRIIGNSDANQVQRINSITESTDRNQLSKVIS